MYHVASTHWFASLYRFASMSRLTFTHCLASANRLLTALAVLIASSVWLSLPVLAEPLTVKPLAEKKVTELPAGPLYWRIENFPDVAGAQSAMTPWSLVAEAGGKVWLLTLGAAGGGTPGGAKVTDLGPIPPVTAPQYLLRINLASGPPGSITAVHSHPGSEAFFVLSGEQTIRTPNGVLRVAEGRPATGHAPDTPMQVSSTGSTDLQALVMFVVDATRAFSSPAEW